MPSNILAKNKWDQVPTIVKSCDKPLRKTYSTLKKPTIFTTTIKNEKKPRSSKLSSLTTTNTTTTVLLLKYYSTTTKTKSLNNNNRKKKNHFKFPFPSPPQLLLAPSLTKQNNNDFSVWLINDTTSFLFIWKKRYTNKKSPAEQKLTNSSLSFCFHTAELLNWIRQSANSIGEPSPDEKSHFSWWAHPNPKFLGFA